MLGPDHSFSVYCGLSTGEHVSTVLHTQTDRSLVTLTSTPSLSLKYYLYLRHGRLLILDQPGVLLNLLLTVGQLLHLVDDNQTFRDLNPLDGN